MRVLLISDNDFARREISMLRRLEVGLVTMMGLRVGLAVPERSWFVTEDNDDQLAPPIRYRLRGGPLTRPLRLETLISRCAESSMLRDEDTESAAIDLVHVLGSGAWAIARDSAQRLGCPLMLECYSRTMIDDAARFERASHANAVPAMWTVPSGALGEEARLRLAWPVEPCEWGVHEPDTPHVRPHDRDPQKPLSLAVLTSAESSGELHALFEGLAMLVDRFDLLLFISESVFVADRRPWRIARKLNLLNRLSVIPDIELRRDLILACDLAIVAEHHGVHRSIILDAMAAAVPLIAQRDPSVGWLIDGVTCRALDDPAPGEWSRVIADLLEDSRGASELGRRAREWVEQQHLASTHIAQLAELYERMLDGETVIPFAGSSS